MGILVRVLVRVAALVLIAVSLISGYVWYRYAIDPLSFDATPARVRIAKGTGPVGITRELSARGAHAPDWLMRVAFRLHGGFSSMKSGVYVFDGPLPLRGILDRLAEGRVTFEEIRFTEGWTLRQIRALVDQHPDLAHDTAGLSEAELIKRIGAREPALEGLLFPSTYYFSPGSSDVEVYRQAYRQMKQTLDDAWSKRNPDLPLKEPYQALVLASIVEKETGVDADRTRIAGVFVNRLRKGMRLQSDPTTIYGLGEAFDGNLRRSHLQADTVFNTYTRGGLPPTPIAAPGLASIQATLHPAATTAIYFVARGDGSSEFSDDLPAHNRAVARYQLQQRRP